MTLPREAWPRLKEAFEGARALASDARPAYLAEVCNGDEALRREVELLLAHHDQAASFLETPAMPLADSLVAKSLAGQCIGPYQVSALIGTGGMGEVYRAHDAKLGRDVAIKVLPPMFTADRERVARFDSEARMLAALNHPHIGAIYGLEEAGGMPALGAGARRRRDAGRSAAPWAGAHGRCVGHRATDRGRAGCCASEEDHPPRLEAGEHQSYTRRPREGVGLRPGESVGE